MKKEVFDMKYEYVTEYHIKAIKEFVDAKGIYISFRKAGKDTIERINQRFACKGHSVLEKSIKEKTLKTPGLELPDFLSKNEEDDAAVKLQKDQDLQLLYGFIGHWEKIGAPLQNHIRLKGVYLSELGLKALQDGNPFFHGVVVADTNPNCVLITRQLMDIIKANKDDLHSYFLTGDYDIHDILYAKIPVEHGSRIVSNKKNIESNKSDEDILLEALNIALENNHSRLLQPDPTGNKDNEMNCIRHGAQINYPIHMAEEEMGNPCVRAVVVGDYDVMMFAPNENPVILDTPQKFMKWYADHDIIPKEVFDASGITNADIINRLVYNKMKCFNLIWSAVDKLAYITRNNKEHKRLVDFANGYGVAKEYLTDFYNHLYNYLGISIPEDILLNPLFDENFINTLGGKIGLYKAEKDGMKTSKTISVANDAKLYDLINYMRKFLFACSTNNDLIAALSEYTPRI